MQRKAWNRFVQLRLSDRASEGCYSILYEHDDKAQNIGILDLVTSKYITLLNSIQELSFVVVISSDDFHTLQKKAKKAPIIFEVSVNIIGSARDADKVADTLLRNRCFLQHPVFLDSRTKYINPQYFYSENIKEDLSNLIGPASRVEAETLSRRLRDGLEDVLGSLGEHMQEQGTGNVRFPLANDVLRTTLKP